MNRLETSLRVYAANGATLEQPRAIATGFLTILNPID
jgi:hypothetical protein